MIRGRSRTRYRNNTIEDLQKFSAQAYYLLAKCLINSASADYPLRDSVLKKQKRSSKFYYTNILGVGPAISATLEEKFQTMDEAYQASVDDLATIKNISPKLAQNIHHSFRSLSEHGYWIENNRLCWSYKEEFPEGKNAIKGYPTGRFTTWLYTQEIRQAISAGCIEEVYNIFVTDRVDNKHRTRERKSRKQALEKYGKQCLRCGKAELKLQVDHILAISAGGDPYKIENLQVLCVACHKWKTLMERDRAWVKHNRPALDFRLAKKL